MALIHIIRTINRIVKAHKGASDHLEAEPEVEEQPSDRAGQTSNYRQFQTKLQWEACEVCQVCPEVKVVNQEVRV